MGGDHDESPGIEKPGTEGAGQDRAWGRAPKGQA